MNLKNNCPFFVQAKIIIKVLIAFEIDYESSILESGLHHSKNSQLKYDNKFHEDWRKIIFYFQIFLHIFHSILLQTGKRSNDFRILNNNVG
jgi:phage-related holin